MNKSIKLVAMTVATMSLVSCGAQPKQDEGASTSDVKIMTLDPGHFHAALIQKNMYDGVSPDVFVYAPAGADLDMHLKRIEGFNTRAENPTKWNEIVYTGADFFEKMIAEKRGNVMMTAGNNQKKTAYIKAAVDNGFNVFADKPMVINSENFPVLIDAFKTAEQKGLLIYDIMTERFEITTMLQKEISLISEVFGALELGTPDNPSVTKESVHHFFKSVSGNPLIRPDWFFDVTQQGEGIVDVNTHLVDLVQWECFPNQVIDYTKDIEIVDANRWTTPMTKAQFAKVTGATTFPEFLQSSVKDDVLSVYANGDITYKLKGVHAKVSVIWNYEAPAGAGDTHFSIMRGSKANVIIRQGAEQNYKPSLYVEPVKGRDAKEFETSLATAVAKLVKTYPGLTLSKTKAGFEVVIPAEYHVGHEAHFGQVTERFLQYYKDGKLPEWEVPNMIAKYYTTTQALDFARRK